MALSKALTRLKLIFEKGGTCPDPSALHGIALEVLLEREHFSGTRLFPPLNSEVKWLPGPQSLSLCPHLFFLTLKSVAAFHIHTGGGGAPLMNV